MGDELGIGIIGAGRIGMLHAQNISRHIPHARVVVVADPRLVCARAAAATSNASDAVADSRDVLGRNDVDAVIICSSTDTHARIIRDAASAGKHIFCEKPLDHDVAEIHRALQAVHQAAVCLQVGFNRRFDPDFKALASRIRAGVIGEPQIVRITSRDPQPPPVDYIKVSGGLFMDMSIHDLDMARHLVQQPVVEVFASGSCHDAAIAATGDLDTAIVVLRFSGGALCCIDNSRRAFYGYDQRIEVFGSAGCLLVPNRTPTRVEAWDKLGQHRDKPQDFFLERYRESYIAEMLEFIESLRSDRAPAVGGQDGLQAVLLAHAARVSCTRNRPVSMDESIAGVDAA